MKKPLHILFRQRVREIFYSIASFFRIKIEKETQIDKKEEIQKILIIRPNYRIGNIIFLTPLINEIYKELPNAQIDIIVGMKLAGDILKEMPNVQNVYAIPRRLLRQPLALYRFIKDIRSQNYDLAINITAGSVSSEIVTSLVNAKYKASFEHQKSFISLTHIVKREGLYTHAGLKSLELMKLFGNDLPKDNLKLDLKLKEDEKIKAKNDFILLVKERATNPYTISLFRNARFDKKIEDSWWKEWHKELLVLDSSIVIIDILSPDITQKLNENVLEYANKNLRILGAFFATCDLYVSADTGPLHLAGASGATSMAFFNKTSKEKFGTLGEENLTLDINTLTPKDVALQTYKKLQEIR